MALGIGEALAALALAQATGKPRDEIRALYKEKGDYGDLAQELLLKRSKAEGTGWLAITTGWAFAVMTGVFTAIACGSPDAHLNPAVTLGFAVKTGDFSLVAPFMAAQLLGAMAGAATQPAAVP